MCQQCHHCIHRCTVFRSDPDTSRSGVKKNELRLLRYSWSPVLSGLVMVAVIIGSRKVGINPDNVATPIAASLGDLITLSLLAGVSSFFFCYRGQRSHIKNQPLSMNIVHSNIVAIKLPAEGSTVQFLLVKKSLFRHQFLHPVARR